jgi:hypothetical protein
MVRKIGNIPGFGRNEVNLENTDSPKRVEAFFSLEGLGWHGVFATNIFLTT